jgi:magnesium-transporting ATPase (P-type)
VRRPPTPGEPGDIVTFEAADWVPADARLILAVTLDLAVATTAA